MVFRYLLIAFFMLITGCISQSPSHRDPASETVSGGDSAAQSSSPCGEGIEVCAVINRNPADQSMVVYDASGNVKYKFPVSTGRETFDIPTNFNINPDSCSDTPTGTFSPQLLRENHYSNTWLVKNPETGKYEDGALMKHSLFFNGGIAIHAAGTKEAAAALGPKPQGDQGTGSGGCVRLYPWDAQTLFDEIASCEKTETKKVCIEREISLPTARLHRTENVVQVPKCKKFAEQARCVDYDAPKPNCTPEERNYRPGHCEDPKQFLVTKKPKSMKIIVKDNRSDAEIAAIRNKCLADMKEYEARKAECIAERVSSIKSQDNQIQSAVVNLTKGERASINRQCNEQLYNEAAARTAQTQSNPVATTNNSAESPSVKAPKPQTKRFKDTKFGKWLNSAFSGKKNEESTN